MTPVKVREIVEEADSLKAYAVSLLSLIMTVMVLYFTHMLSLWFHHMKMCSKSSVKCYGSARLVLTFLLSLAAIGILIKLFLIVADHKVIKYLATH